MFRRSSVWKASAKTTYSALEGTTALFVRNSSCSNMMDKFKLPARYGTFEKNIWGEYSRQLAQETKPKANLGQGFPDYFVPDLQNAVKALAQVAASPNPLLNQYTRGLGHPRLVQSLAKVYSPLIKQNLNPMTQILVTIGAYGSLHAVIHGLIDNGDEVIVMEPFFDCYDYMIKNAGGIPKYIQLELKNQCETVTSADWVFDENKLASLFSSKTKLIIVNTPHNPTGKLFTQCELELIACLCQKHNVICVSDEVYEWMAYPPNVHIRMSTLPGMFERTITICSAGKTFSATGWKMGWSYGPENIMKYLQLAHTNVVYTCSTPTQEALAICIEQELAANDPECYFKCLVKELQPKRDLIVNILRENGFNPTVPDGGYFVMADWTKLGMEEMDLSTEKDTLKDFKFTKKFCKEASVLGIPPSAFYSKQSKHLGENYVRFCFIKKDENLQLSGKLMKEWNSKTKAK